MSFSENIAIFIQDSKSYLFLIGLIILYFFISLWVAINYSVLTPDGTQYISIGQNIIDFGKYKSNGSHFPDIIQPPLYPLLISFFYMALKDPFLSGLVVSSLFRTLSVIPLFLIACKYFDKRIAKVTTLLFIAYPLLFANSINAQSESTYCFVFLFVVYFILMFLRRRSLARASLIGVLTGILCCVRVDGLNVLIIFFVLLLIDAFKFHRLKYNSLCLFSYFLGFLVIYLPLIFFVNFQSGQWILSPKIRLLMIHKKIWVSSKIDPAFYRLSETLKYERAIFKYSHRSAGLLANKLFFNKVNSPLDQKINDSSYPNHGLFLLKIKKIVKLGYFFILNYLSNLYKIYKQISYALVFPPLLFPMLLFGLIEEPWTKDLWRINLTLFTIIVVSGSFLFSHLDFRFLFPIVPIALLWCARGVVYFSKWTVASLKNIDKIVSVNLVTYLIVGTIISSMIPSMVSICKDNLNRSRKQHDIAALIKKNVSPEATVIARNPQSCYLAERKYAPLPYLAFEELLDYSSRFSKSALILSKQEEYLRPELSHRLNQLIEESIENAPFKIVSYNGCTIVNFN